MVTIVIFRERKIREMGGFLERETPLRCVYYEKTTNPSLVREGVFIVTNITYHP